MKFSTPINTHKALLIPLVLAMMWYYGNWSGRANARNGQDIVVAWRGERPRGWWSWLRTARPSSVRPTP